MSWLFLMLGGCWDVSDDYPGITSMANAWGVYWPLPYADGISLRLAYESLVMIFLWLCNVHPVNWSRECLMVPFLFECKSSVADVCGGCAGQLMSCGDARGSGGGPWNSLSPRAQGTWLFTTSEVGSYLANRGQYLVTLRESLTAGLYLLYLFALSVQNKDCALSNMQIIIRQWDEAFSDR